MFTKSHKRTPSGKKKLDITLNVEQLTNEERISRSLHSHVRRVSNAERPHLFEWFLVIGLEKSPDTTPSTSTPTNNSSKPTIGSKPPLPNSKAHSSPSNLPYREKPKVLYQYPPHKPLGSINVEDFPFPSGVLVTHQSQTASHTNLFQLLYTQHHLKEYEDSFVFMLTDERKDVLYGVCTMKLSPLKSAMNGIIDINEEEFEGDYVEAGESIPTAQKCFVILTKYPFFPLHFNILNGVLAIQHVQSISKFQNMMSYKIKKKAQQQPQNDTPSILVTNSDNNNNNNNHQEEVFFKQPIKELIDYFYSQPVPVQGQTVSYNVPNLDTTITFRRASMKPPITDVTADYNDFTLEYGLFATLQLLPHKILLTLINAALLEKKLVFYSKSLRCLTSVIFTIVSILKPFTYQSVILPIIPDTLKDVLSAPVPFIIGVNNYNHGDIDLNDVLLVDIDKSKILTSMPAIPLFPRWKECANHMIEIEKQLRHTYDLRSKQLNFIANDAQETILDLFSSSIHHHLESLFSNFKRHCIRDVSQLRHVSVFVPETFVIEYDDEKEQEWITQFMKTQIFSVYQDKLLRTIDGEEEVDEISDNFVNNNNNQNNNLNNNDKLQKENNNNNDLKDISNLTISIVDEIIGESKG